MLGFLSFLVCSLLFLNADFIKSDGLGHFCPNETLYDSNSSSGKTYRTNLKFLLSALTANASRPNGFYNFTAGRATDPPGNTTVYGLFLCRGDVGTGECQTCVNAAGSDVLQLCPDIKVATIWYEKCMLRYSDRSIFSTLDTGGFKTTSPNSKNATERDEFGKVLHGTFNQVTKAAASDLSGKKFAVRESYVDGLQMIYALGQCTPDLSSSDCGTCLGDLVQSIPDYYPEGEKVLAVNCNIRYETYLFYNVSGFPPPPPPPPLSATSTQPTSKGSGVSISVGVIVAIIVVPIFVAIVINAVVLYIVIRKWKPRNVMVETTVSAVSKKDNFGKYRFSEIRNWTNNFADDHKLGGGGFGNVYKGTLPNGQEIAVKRLFRGSAQGTKEFVNEITLLAKLQHRNLVRLLGYCLKGEEKMLVYEFVPKRSLDYILFDLEKQQLLDWLTRYNIVGGIAKGLLYLHEESPLKIIHRDLKASNVLLDENMTPKIADFGLARIFELDQSKGSTSKIAGTYGYMAPEYAMKGVISVKSDVYSFGVLVMEIITGNKSSNFSQMRVDDDLLSYAWRKWRDGTPLGLLDPSIKDSCNENEVIRCIHIGLLCVQEDVESRPTMASVVLMLNSYSITLPIPKPPSFFRSSYNNAR